MLRFISKFQLFALFLIFFYMLGKAQSIESPIINALQQGSSKTISKFLGDKVEIRFDNDKRDFSKSQAEIVLSNFFKDNPVSSFKLQKQRKIDAERCYLIGTYTSTSGRFSVLIKGKELKDGSWLIYSLDFVGE